MVFIFIGGYLPGKKYGGPVTSIENFVNQLCDNYEMRIVCNDHDFNETEKYEGIQPGWNTLGNARAWFLNEKDYSVKNFVSLMAPFKDRIVTVYLSGIYYYRMNNSAILAAKKLGVPVISAPRGDLMKNSIAMKGTLSKLKKETFLTILKLSGIYNNVFIQATSEEEAFGAKKYLNISEDRIFQIPNLPMKAGLNERHRKKKNTLKMVSVSRIMVKKNILDSIKALNLVPEGYHITFDIYGPIESEEYWAECLEEIKKVQTSEKNVEYKGALSPDEAKHIYSQYDVFSFPTLSENYGHVIIEAMLCDCPVLLTKGTTPWDDYSENGVYLSELHDLQGLSKNVLRFAKMDDSEYNQEITKNRDFIRNKLNVEAQVEAYLSMMKTVQLRF